jgi:hypothetical protein
MWRQLYDYARHLVTLKEQTERNAADIKAIRDELKELTTAVQRLAFELRRLGENEAHEREKMALRLENTLLRSERRLPPGNREADPDSAPDS